MKKFFFSLIFISFVSLSYGQAIEMSTVVPTAPVAVVDELRVIGTGSTDTSTIGTINLGIVPGAQEMPFQKQVLDVAGNISNVAVLNAGRSLFYTGTVTGLNSAEVYNNGTIFAEVSSFTSASAGLFKAASITGPTSGSLSGLYNISSNTLTIDGMEMEDPFGKGTSVTSKNKIIADGLSDTGKYHIYYPWKNTNSESTQCNSDGTLCRLTQCDTCTSGSSSTTCYDSRTVTIPDSYNANGATYEKIGSVKFYCKPAEVFDSEGENATHAWDAEASGCKQYMVSSLNRVLLEGFTSAVGGTAAVSRPIASTVVTNGTNVIDAFTAHGDNLGEICYSLCNSAATGCAADSQFLLAYNADTDEVVNLNSIFGDTHYCDNAAWGEGEGWPIGSGLTCKTTETSIDVFSLSCPQFSGAKQAGGTTTQYRKVACKQYSNVSAEVNNISSNKNEITNKAYFYPEFE